MYTQFDIHAFEVMIENTTLRRPIKFIDTHHTFIPAKAHWRGESTVRQMAAFHRSLGWADIGQHWSIDPDGYIWSGRDLNAIPCSQTGFNTGALMYEMIGNFCEPGEPGSKEPYDTLEGPQLEAAVAVSAAVLAKWRLPAAAVRFHRQLHLPGYPPPKTCPGLTIDQSWFTGLVEDRAWSRWNYDPPGGQQFVAALEHDPSDTEGSGEPDTEALLAFLESNEGSATV